MPIVAGLSTSQRRVIDHRETDASGAIGMAEKGPNQTDALENAKRALAQSSLDLDAVRKIQLNVEAVQPQSDREAAQRSYLLGLCGMLGFQGDIDVVLGSLQAAAQKAPERADYVATLVETLVVANRIDEARQSLYLAEDPSHERIRELHAKVDQAAQTGAMDTDVTSRLLDVADDALTAATSITLTPWIWLLPPWKYFAPNPALRTLIFSVGLFLVVTALSYRDLTPTLLFQYLAAIGGIYVGLNAVTFSVRRFEDIFRVLNRNVRLRSDRLLIWYKVNISPLWGYVNHPDAEALDRYGWRELWKYDRVILLWYFLSLAGGVFVTGPAYARLIPPQGSLTWLAQCLIVICWQASSLWGIHFLFYSLGFMRRLSRLEHHYYYGMPRERSLKSVGRIVVLNSSFFSIWFFFLFLVCYAWGSMAPDPNVAPAINDYVLTLVLATNVGAILCLFGIVFAVQAALTTAMQRYKAKRQAEYAAHTEMAFERFIQTPGDEAYRELTDRVKQGKKIFSRLPVLSFTLVDAIALIALAVLISGFLWWVVVATDGAVEAYRDLGTRLLRAIAPGS